MNKEKMNYQGFMNMGYYVNDLYFFYKFAEEFLIDGLQNEEEKEKIIKSMQIMKEAIQEAMKETMIAICRHGDI